MPRSLILAPTRELAAQVAQSFEKYGVNHKLNVALLIGGVSMDDQVRKLDRGVDVLIATPGRLLDHFGRGRIMLMGVEILVIDEADRMLDMGFIPDIEKICKLLPPKRQTLFFSATMPAEITRLVDQFLTEPVRIEAAKPATTAKTITQRFKFCANGEDWAKREVLRDLIGSLDVRNAIIFCNRKKDVAILLKSLTKHGFNAGALHGDMDQSSRTATLDKFRAGEIALLAASNVAARGLDIPDVSHVINYDVPWQPDDYVHRIGRTGRAGKEGFSATIVTPDDIKAIDAIGKLIGEETQWIGDAPDEAAMADARSRKRRGRGAPASVRGRSSERPERAERGPRPERGERPQGGERGPRPERGERPARRDQAPNREAPPERREATRRLALTDRPEGGDQPELPHDVVAERRRPVRRRERDAGPSEQRRETTVAAVDAVRTEPSAQEPRRIREPRRERPSHVAGASSVETRSVEQQPTQSRSHEPRPHEARHEPRNDSGQRQGRPPRRDQGAQEPRDRRPQRPQQSETTPAAFGDHMPAFLRRPVRASAE